MKRTLNFIPYTRCQSKFVQNQKPDTPNIARKANIFADIDFDLWQTNLRKKHAK